MNAFWLKGVLVVMACCYVPFFADPAGLPRWILLSLFLLIASVHLLWVSKLQQLPMPKTTCFLLLGFLGWAALSRLWSFDSWATWIAWKKLWLGTQVFFLTSICAISLKKTTQPWGWGLLAGSVVAVIGLLQAHEWLLSIDQIVPPAATFMNKNVAAQFLVGLSPIFFTAALGRDRWQWLGLIGGAAVFAYLWIVAARGAWLAIGFALGGVLAAFPSAPRHFFLKQLFTKMSVFGGVFLMCLSGQAKASLFTEPPLLGILIVSVALVIGFFLGKVLLSPNLPAWLSKLPKASPRVGIVIFIGLLGVALWSIQMIRSDPYLEGFNHDPHVNTVQARFGLYANGLKMMAQHPFLGVGWGQLFQEYPNYNQAWLPTHSMSVIAVPHYLHQDFLQIMVELGLIGGVLFLSWLGIVLRTGLTNAFAQPSKNPWRMVPFWCLIAILCHSMVSFPLQQPASGFLFWFFAGLLVLGDAASAQRPLKVGKSLKIGLVIVHVAVFLSFAIWGYSSNLQYQANQQLRKGDLDAGYSLSQKAHEVFPGDPLPLDQVLTLASRYAQNRQAALQVANSFLERYPNHPNGYFRKAFILHSMADDQEALKTVQKACDLATTDPEPWLLKGLILRGLGQNQIAVTAFQEVLKRHPTHGPALEQLRQLRISQTE